MTTPFGFRPWEISAMVNETVVAQHAEEAAFLWTLRNRAAAEPHYTLNNLATLDERVEAHLDGLSVAGPHAWALCRANLEHLGPGEVFALGVLAFRSGNRAWMREALEAGCASPQVQAGLVSALGWLDADQAAPWMSLLLRAAAPEHRRVGIAAHAVHRRDPGDALAAALRDEHPLLRARALRAAGELRRSDLAGGLRRYLRDDDPDCRFWCAWSLLLLGDADGLEILRTSVESQDRHCLAALNLMLRATAPADARRWVQWLASHESHDQLAVVATGIFGDPVSAGWLIRKMEAPRTARLAGEAFSLISGVDLRLQDLTAEPAEEPEAEPWATYESNLPTPAPALVSAWWAQNVRGFQIGVRHLCGRPVSSTTAARTLTAGTQRQRHAAALEWACLDAQVPLYEVRAPAKRQQRHAETWTS